jgi:hypothetical protein
MKLPKVFAIVLGAYLVLVVAFESLVGFMGKRQAEHGVEPDEHWLVITTTDGDGHASKTVIGGVESDGHVYVSANHWPRGWFNRAMEHPDVEVTRAGETKPYLATQVGGEERERVAAQYQLPWVVRFLSGFPPRSFLRLDPR